MKRLMIFIVSIAVTVSLAVNVNASDSASVTGVGFVVSGSINENYLSGSITGQYSSGATVYVYGQYYNVDAEVSNFISKSGSPYCNYYIRNTPTYNNKSSWKWRNGYVTGVPNSGGASQTTRMLWN